MPPTGSTPLQRPHAVDLVLSLVNTHAGGREDLLADADGLRGWLEAVGHPDPAASDADAAAGRELRDALQVLLRSHAADPDLERDDVARAEARLQRLTSLIQLRPVVSAGGTRLEPACDGVWGAYGAVLAAVAELDRGGAWLRLKACRNHICHAGFFDRSRNASAVYHGPSCASMVSMRAYRQRKRDAAGRESTQHD
jgi:predicted RNA-binding Zn ribbon-like protein